MPAPNWMEDAWVTINMDPDDDYAMIVKHAKFDGIEERVDLGPNPTWPTPAEATDLVVEAVRRCLDKAWEAASGEPVTR
jgi:hypothetical protein